MDKRSTFNTYELQRDPSPAPPMPSVWDAPPDDADPTAAPRPRRRAARHARRLLAVLIAITAIAGGVRLRQIVWARAGTGPSAVHHGDVASAFNWGERVVVGSGGGASDVPPNLGWGTFLGNYLSLYDRVRTENADRDYGLDAPPLRLLATALWVRHLHARGIVGPGAHWDASYAVNAPLLNATIGFELLAALGALLLVRLWVRRGRSPVELPLLSGGRHLSGNGHARSHARGAPDDVPLYCGLAAAVLLFLNPALVLDAHAWPQWDAWLLPFFLFAALLASTERWLSAGVLLALGAMFKGQLLLVAPLFVLWPLFARKPRAALYVLAGFALATFVVVSPWLVRRSMGWYEVGFAYGLRHFPRMTVDASNLPAILASRAWNWQPTDTVWTIDVPKLHVSWPLTMRPLLIGVYALSLVLCAWGAARKSRRHDPRVLAALVAPWVVLVAVMPQMHGRYLVWGAALAATMAGVSLGMTLLHLLVTALATVMVLRPLLAIDPKFAPAAAKVLDGLHPNIGWSLLLCAAIFLYEALAPSHRRILPRDSGG